MVVGLLVVVVVAVVVVVVVVLVVVVVPTSRSRSSGVTNSSSSSTSSISSSFTAILFCLHLQLNRKFTVTKGLSKIGNYFPGLYGCDVRTKPYMTELLCCLLICSFCRILSYF